MVITTITEGGPTRNTLIVWLTVFVVVSFLAFMSNLGTILTFYKKKALRRRGVYCLINLAVADMIHGFFSMLWFLIYLDYIGIDFLPFKLTDSGLRITAGIINTCTLVLSLFCLLLVSLDRVYATFYPFHYRTTSVKCCLRVFAMTWVASFIIAVIPAFYVEYRIYSHDLWYDNLNFVCLLCLGLNILAYVATFLKIRKQNRDYQQNQGQGVQSIQRRERQERHLAVTLLIVTILSLITWLPFIINHEVQMASKEPTPPNQKYYIELITEVIQLCNSLINSIVYFFRIKDYRKALLEIFLPKCFAVEGENVNNIHLNVMKRRYSVHVNGICTPRVDVKGTRKSIEGVVNAPCAKINLNFDELEL